VKFNGYSIADVLDLAIEDALPVLADIPNVRQKLQTLVDVGLGYIHLGQAATTLSGGEAQRMKLARELSKRQTGRTLYLLDEPTTGLHFDDVRRLLEVLHRLTDLGNTVIIIEHNLDVVRNADWLIDLGPEGGEEGGQHHRRGYSRIRRDRRAFAYRRISPPLLHPDRRPAARGVDTAASEGFLQWSEPSLQNETCLHPRPAQTQSRTGVVMQEPKWNVDSPFIEVPDQGIVVPPIRIVVEPDGRMPDLFPSPEIVEVPSLVHTVLFFLLAIFIVFVGELATFTVGRQLPAFRHEDFAAQAGDPRLIIPAQALPYLVLLLGTTALFGAIWHQPFWKAIHWNLPAAPKRWLALLGLGAILGLGSAIGGNYLPMPKEAPILNDLMRSTTGAWLMFIFGTAGAPVVEELAFRGFLLPSLVNFLRSLQRRGTISPAVATWAGLPLAILLTSVPFALLHSLQVSYAWAPILLIGIVSVALCLVRIVTNSLAASTLVHATYNFCLFASMLVASDGFRHLEKLNN
jgi:membrane protease YdiL (CAAX protease family)